MPNLLVVNAFHTVKILKKLKIIDDFAFQNTKLRNITIPRHVVEIKANSFENCKNLQEFNFSDDSELKKN